MIFIALAIAASIAAGVEAERRKGARAGVFAASAIVWTTMVAVPLLLVASVIV